MFEYKSISFFNECGVKFISAGKAKEIVKEVVEEYNNGWIPCSDKLPEDGLPVLLQDSDGYYSLGVSETKRNIKGFRDGDWWGSANNYKAWQPLPEPFKESD